MQNKDTTDLSNNTIFPTTYQIMNHYLGTPLSVIYVITIY